MLGLKQANKFQYLTKSCTKGSIVLDLSTPKDIPVESNDSYTYVEVLSVGDWDQSNVQTIRKYNSTYYNLYVTNQ